MNINNDNSSTTIYKLKSLILLLQFLVISNFVIASEQELTWSLGIVVSTVDSATDALNFFIAYRGHSNNILAENNTHVTLGLPTIPGAGIVDESGSLPSAVYIGGGTMDNASSFESFVSTSTDNVVIVQALYVYTGSGYERWAGITIADVSTPEFPLLSFVATEIDDMGTPPAITILLHELFHRSGHAPPRVSGPMGHTEDGNIMRAGPRDQDTGITADQKSWIRSHVETGGYYPPIPE